MANDKLGDYLSAISSAAMIAIVDKYVIYDNISGPWVDNDFGTLHPAVGFCLKIAPALIYTAVQLPFLYETARESDILQKSRPRISI